MLHWICPECGRECEPVERDCPDCYPEAAALVTMGATSAASHTASSSVVSIPQVITGKTGIVLPPPLPPPLPIPSFLLPNPEPAVAPAPVPVAVHQEPEIDPVPAGLAALSVISLAAQSSGKQQAPPPLVAALLEPVFSEDAQIAGLPVTSGVEPEPLRGPRPVSAPQQTAVFPQHRAFRPAPAAFLNGANALAFDAIAYQEEEAHLAEPAGFARSSGLELESDPALLEVLEREAAATREEDLWAAFATFAGRVPHAVVFSPVAKLQPQAARAGDADVQYLAQEVPATPLAAVQRTASIAEDINLLAKVATYEAHQRTVRALDASAAQMGPLLYRRFRPVPRTIANQSRTSVLRFWPWVTEDPILPAWTQPDSLPFDPQVLEAIQQWEVEQQRLEAEAAMPELVETPEPSLMMGPEVPTMYHLAIPVIPPPQQPQAFAPPPPPPVVVEAAPVEEIVVEETVVEEEPEDRFSKTMRFQVPVPRQAAAPVEVEPVEIEDVEVEPVVLEPVVDLPVLSTEIVLVSKALTRFDASNEASNADEAILTPIVEASVPPMAKQVTLPWYGLSPVGTKPAPRDLNIPPVFTIADAYIPPRSVAASSPIPSPLLHSRNATVSRPPSWLVTLAVASLIPITALGVVNYWILPAQRASAASDTVSTAPPTVAGEVPAAASWRKQLQITGIRMQDSKVRFVLINHAKSDAPAMSLLVHLRSVNAKPSDPAIGTFQIRLSPLAPAEARDLSSSVELSPSAKNVDWTDIRADIQAAKLL